MTFEDTVIVALLALFGVSGLALYVYVVKPLAYLLAVAYG